MTQDTLNKLLWFAPILIGIVITLIKSIAVDNFTEKVEAWARNRFYDIGPDSSRLSRYLFSPILRLFMAFCDWTDKINDIGFKSAIRIVVAIYLILITIYAIVFITFIVVFIFLLVFFINYYSNYEKSQEVSQIKPKPIDIKPKHEIKNIYTEYCKCKKCNTYAVISIYYCGCVEVEIYNDKAPCDGCTDFSGKRYTNPKCF